jgi:hypothetical protein
MMLRLRPAHGGRCGVVRTALNGYPKGISRPLEFGGVELEA